MHEHAHPTPADPLVGRHRPIRDCPGLRDGHAVAWREADSRLG